jgi:hypothetical protein
MTHVSRQDITHVSRQNMTLWNPGGRDAAKRPSIAGQSTNSHGAAAHGATAPADADATRARRAAAMRPQRRAIMASP